MKSVVNYELVLIMIENLPNERGFNRILSAMPIKRENKINWRDRHKIYQHQWNTKRGGTIIIADSVAVSVTRLNDVWSRKV